MKPIAWYDPSNGVVSTDQDCPLFTPLGQVWPLCPKREWVGLTDEEMQDCIKTADYNQGQYKRTAYWAHLATALTTAIEQALKEKNT
jgi:hypothetical protein